MSNECQHPRNIASNNKHSMMKDPVRSSYLPHNVTIATVPLPHADLFRDREPSASRYPFVHHRSQDYITVQDDSRPLQNSESSSNSIADKYLFSKNDGQKSAAESSSQGVHLLSRVASSIADGEDLLEVGRRVREHHPGSGIGPIKMGHLHHSSVSHHHPYRYATSSQEQAASPSTLLSLSSSSSSSSSLSSGSIYASGCVRPAPAAGPSQITPMPLQARGKVPSPHRLLSLCDRDSSAYPYSSSSSSSSSSFVAPAASVAGTLNRRSSGFTPPQQLPGASNISPRKTAASTSPSSFRPKAGQPFSPSKLVHRHSSGANMANLPMSSLVGYNNQTPQQQHQAGGQVKSAQDFPLKPPSPSRKKQHSQAFPDHNHHRGHHYHHSQISSMRESDLSYPIDMDMSTQDSQADRSDFSDKENDHTHSDGAATKRWTFRPLQINDDEDDNSDLENDAENDDFYDEHRAASLGRHSHNGNDNNANDNNGSSNNNISKFHQQPSHRDRRTGGGCHQYSHQSQHVSLGHNAQLISSASIRSDASHSTDTLEADAGEETDVAEVDIEAEADELCSSVGSMSMSPVGSVSCASSSSSSVRLQHGSGILISTSSDVSDVVPATDGLGSSRSASNMSEVSNKSDLSATERDTNTHQHRRSNVVGVRESSSSAAFSSSSSSASAHSSTSSSKFSSSALVAESAVDADGRPSSSPDPYIVSSSRFSEIDDADFDTDASLPSRQPVHNRNSGHARSKHGRISSKATGPSCSKARGHFANHVMDCGEDDITSSRTQVAESSDVHRQEKSFNSEHFGETSPGGLQPDDSVLVWEEDILLSSSSLAASSSQQQQVQQKHKQQTPLVTSSTASSSKDHGQTQRRTGLPVAYPSPASFASASAASSSQDPSFSSILDLDSSSQGIDLCDADENEEEDDEEDDEDEDDDDDDDCLVIDNPQRLSMEQDANDHHPVDQTNHRRSRRPCQSRASKAKGVSATSHSDGSSHLSSGDISKRRNPDAPLSPPSSSLSLASEKGCSQAITSSMAALSRSMYIHPSTPVQGSSCSVSSYMPSSTTMDVINGLGRWSQASPTVREPLWWFSQMPKNPFSDKLYNSSSSSQESSADDDVAISEKSVWRWMLVNERRHACHGYYFEQHPSLNARMRYILIDWLSEVCDEYYLHREVLYLAIHYVDRFFCITKNQSRDELQTVGAAALFIAAKLEEIFPPSVNEFASVCDGACTVTDILRMELKIMKSLDWEMMPPTANFFANLYMQNAARYRPRRYGWRASDNKNKSSFKNLSTITPDSKSFVGPRFNTSEYTSLMNILDIATHMAQSLDFGPSILAAAALQIVHEQGAPGASVASVQDFMRCTTGYTLEQLREAYEWFLKFSNWPVVHRPSLFPDIAESDQHNIQVHNKSLLDCLDDFSNGGTGIVMA